ncbi:MAG: BrnT family toxin [Nitrospira sp.]|nr:BrnT family toxin [Nitrospira sp.]
MRYEWDEAKNRSNRAKHGLDFADAERVFAGRCVTFVDDRFDYGENRLVSLGTLAGRVVVMAHSPRGHETTRIISMRKANRREQKIYQKRLGET